MTADNDIYRLLPDGGLQFRFHAGQRRAWNETARWVVLLSGTQGGKTVFGPPWLYREMQRRGPGDYMVTTPTFPLLDKKALPEFRRLFEDMLALGRYVGSPSRRFELSDFGQRRLWGESGEAYRSTVWFGYAADPDSLESATAKAVWNDEAGQPKFKLGSWEAIQRRLSIHQGRALFTTTPYYHGWLKRQFWDGRDNPDVGLVNFESVENPAFPLDEYERARRQMPPWKFDMFYRGRFTQPAGLIYDVFDRERHVVEPFDIPADWPRYVGMDFGGVNTAAVFLAESPDGVLYLYREYLQGGKTAAAHARDIQHGEPRLTAYGGAKSEGQWRDEFRAGGLHIYEPPVSDVEVGIDRVYQLWAGDRLRVLESCEQTIDQAEGYSRPVDDEGNVKEGIQDKASYHYLDALRYIASYLARFADGQGGIHV